MRYDPRLIPVGVGTPAYVQHDRDLSAVVDAISDSIAAASRDPPPIERCPQRLAESAGVVAQRSVIELSCGCCHRDRKFVGEGSARWPGDFQVVAQSVSRARRKRSATMVPMSSPLVVSPALRDSSASARRSWSTGSLWKARVSIIDS